MMKRIFNDHDARPWWIVLGVLLVLLGVVQWAGAASLDWTHETDSAEFLPYVEPNMGISCYGGGFQLDSGEILVCIPISNQLWSTTNGVNWTLKSEEFPTDESQGARMLEYDGAIWVFERDNVHNSSDGGVTWDVVTYTSGYPNTRYPGAAVKDNKMWVWGGYYSSWLQEWCYNSSDGVSWTEVSSDIGTFADQGVSWSSNDVLYYAQGDDVYYSSDGATWDVYSDVLPIYGVFTYSPIMEWNGKYYIFTPPGELPAGVLSSEDSVNWEMVDDWESFAVTWQEQYESYENYCDYALYIINGTLYVAGGRYWDPLAGEEGEWVMSGDVWSAELPSDEPPPDPGPDDNYLYWKLVKDGFTYSTSIIGHFFEHNGVLFLMTSPNGVLYENPSGNPYSAWYTVYTASNPADPYDPSGLTFPAVIEYNNTVWVLGGNPRYNYTWQSNEYINWADPSLTTWSVRCTTSWDPSGDVGGAFTSYDGYLWRIGSNEETQVYRTVLGDTWELVSSSLPFTWASLYANESYIYALTANESGNNSFYRSTTGSSWTLLNASAIEYKYAPDNVLKNVIEWDGKLWVVGGGSEATYYSRNGGYNWHLNREYCEEYPEIDHTTAFITFDASGSTPEMIYSYSMWTGEIWAGAYFPQADFTGIPRSGTYPLEVAFTDTSINNPTSWLWQFGDGYTSTSQNPTHTYEWDGTFDVSLAVSNTYGSDTETKADYVTVGDIAGVSIWGHIYDAITGDAIPSANISFMQYATYQNTTSNATGGYSFGSVFYKDESINTNSACSGYTPWPTNFMVMANGTYEYDLYMLPFDSWNTTGIVGGFVYDEVWAQGVPNATVSMWNGSWSDTNLTNSAGFYWFENVTSTAYSVNATALNFDNSETYSVTGNATGFVQQDIPLSPNYDLVLVFKNADTYGIVYDNVSYVLSNATNGSVLFQNSTTAGIFALGLLDYGLYNFSAACEGYYPYSAEIYLYSNVSEEIFLDPIEDFDGANTNYIPRPIRFTYVDAYGNPVTGAIVTATVLESTNPWSWLESVFGFSSTADIQGTVLSGTTGSDGTLSFMMIETIEYRVHCVKASAGIDHSVDIYPKNTEYFIRIGSLPIAGGGNYPTYSLNATTAGSNVVLFGNYTDTSGETSSLRFIVVNSTGGEVYNTSVTLTYGVGSASYAVNNTMYDQYTYGLVAEHDTHGTIEKWIDITLKGTGRLIDFGEGWTDFMYLVMSVAGIFLVAGCFGEIDVKLGAFFVPLMGSFFLYIGWLPLQYAAFISIAGFLGGLYYIRGKLGELWK